jgi:hypothetical protein
MAYEDKSPSQNKLRCGKKLPTSKDFGIDEASPVGFWGQEDVEASAQDEGLLNSSGPWAGKSKGQKK